MKEKNKEFFKKGNGVQRRDEGSENEYARKPERRSIKMTKRSGKESFKNLQNIL